MIAIWIWKGVLYSYLWSYFYGHRNRLWPWSNGSVPSLQLVSYPKPNKLLTSRQSLYMYTVSLVFCWCAVLHPKSYLGPIIFVQHSLYRSCLVALGALGMWLCMYITVWDSKNSKIAFQMRHCIWVLYKRPFNKNELYKNKEWKNLHSVL